MPGGPSTDNLNGGWIRAYRSLFDPRRDPFWEYGMRTGDFRQWAAWLYCLSLVNYGTAPQRLFVRGRLVAIGQGDFFITQENLARAVGWKSRQPARDFLEKLVQLGRIGPQKEPLQVVNWQDYNAKREPQEEPQHNHRETTGKPPSNHEQETMNKKPIRLTSSATPTTPVCPAKEIVDSWNAMAAANSLPQVKATTAGRLKSVRARWTSPFWREHWKEALAAVPTRPFLLGQGDRGWRADFEWFVRPDTVPKLIEGAYNGTPGNRAGKGAIPTRYFAGASDPARISQIAAAEAADRARAHENAPERGSSAAAVAGGDEPPGPVGKGTNPF